MPNDTSTRVATAAGIRFTIASRPQRRFSNTQTVSIFAGPTSFQPISLPATGFVRKLTFFFVVNFATASAASVVAGDGPYNLINGITVTDATGQPIMQPISGFNLRLVNKYLGSGTVKTNMPRAYMEPGFGPEYAYSATGAAGSATFRLDVDFEQDSNNGYGSIPNLDSNASLQVKIDAAQYTNAFSGTGPISASMSVRICQYYWAPVGASIGGVSTETQPIGIGDYVETRYETGTVNASAENTYAVSNRGGLIKGVIGISRAAGVRTDFTAATNIGCILDNNPIDEGILLEEQKDMLRRTYGYMGADYALSYAPLGVGILPGLDRGVMVWPFGDLSSGRDSWLSTRVGSLFQLKFTPGASATQWELVTQLAQVKDPAAFYMESALD